MKLLLGLFIAVLAQANASTALVNDTPDYCTGHKDYNCHRNGYAACCENPWTCPESPPPCDTPEMSYCTWGPYYDCYESGYPACCADSDPNSSCPASGIPPCDKATGESYCTYSPDYSCYAGGWPGCCLEDDSSGPETKPG
ncbi:hypothetical protein ACHAXS_000116, partial [Conticribra weissflogii]